MESSIFKKATKFLQEHKNNHRWQAAFLTMAAAAALGTVGVLTLTGHAQTYKAKKLVCEVADHAHTDECFGPDGKLVCDKPEMILHTHNTVDCYNDDGVLVCSLEEREPHEHTDACYEETEVLACELEESEGHHHTDDCYTEEGGGELICDIEEHTHGEECYDEEGNLVCGMEEHEHTDDCYSQPEKVLTCGMEESEGHTHTQDCYTTERKLICENTYLEHTHTDECYTEHRDETTGEVFYTLDCGKKSAAIHTHGSECIVEEEVSADELMTSSELEETAGEDAENPAEDAESEAEKVLICGLEEHQHSDDCKDPETGEYICGKTEHKHTDECYGIVEEPADETEAQDAGGAEAADETAEEAGTEEAAPVMMKIVACGKEEHTHEPECLQYGCGKKNHEHTDACYMEVYEEPQVYTDDDVTIKAYYGKDAGLEGAVLKATPVESDESYEDAVKNMPDMEGRDIASMMLYDIGFYRTEDGVETETEPADGSKVLIRIQFNGEDGVAEGEPLTVVHFTEDGEAEMLQSSEEPDGSSVSFMTGSFSVFALADGDARAASYRQDDLRYIVSGAFLFAAVSLFYINHLCVERRRRRAKSSGKRQEV